ncbi:MAG: hypothetical protein AUG51_26275 [Acidobacteria bacterium 13_1_20CM_3_53_8]|nr:MAG: hypothetical protein AUG51_26275 [Acidobacteria bacterium 13_1_20CM_3_53_8]
MPGMIMIGVLPVRSLAGRKIWAKSGCSFGLERIQPFAQTISAIMAEITICLIVNLLTSQS